MSSSLRRYAPVCVVLAAAVSITVTGCSSSKKDPSSAPPTTAASSSATPSATASLSATQLAAINLEQSDLPTGWKASPASPDSDAKAAQAQIAACVGGRDTSADSTGVTQSPDFNLADATISSQVTAFRSQDAVESDAAMLKSPKIDSCYAKVAKEQVGASLPAGTTISDVSVHVTPGAGTHPSNVVATIDATVTVTDGGQKVTVYVTSALITGPQAEVEVDFENVGQQIPADLQDRLIAVVADRAAHG